MELVVVTSPDKFQSEIPAAIELFQSGLMTLHLRKSKFSTTKLKEYIEAIPEQYHNRIILHTHHKLAFQFNLKGIHLTKHHRKSPVKLFFKITLFRLRKPKLLITRSFHQIESITENRTRFSYAFLNPFFSKIDPLKNSFDVNREFLSKSIAKSRCPVYASGNISMENYQAAKGMNLSGMAVSKLLWQYEGNKGDLFRKIQEEIAQW